MIAERKEEPEADSINIAIGFRVGGALLVLMCALGLVFWWYQRQTSDAEVQGNEDENPVYGLYSDIYHASEVYDRNVYYGGEDD